MKVRVVCALKERTPSTPHATFVPSFTRSLCMLALREKLHVYHILVTDSRDHIYPFRSFARPCTESGEADWHAKALGKKQDTTAMMDADAQLFDSDYVAEQFDHEDLDKDD
jgi:hypothetical protein